MSWQNEDQLRFVLREGRKRQIRRMCELVGLKVVGLKRVRIGSVSLGQLPVGQWRYLRRDEKFWKRQPILTEPLNEATQMSSHVHKLVELVGSSPLGVDDAIRNAIETAAASVRHMDWYEVTEIPWPHRERQACPPPGQAEGRFQAGELTGPRSRALPANVAMQARLPIRMRVPRRKGMYSGRLQTAEAALRGFRRGIYAINRCAAVVNLSPQRHFAHVHRAFADGFRASPD